MTATVRDVMTADVLAVHSDTSFKDMAAMISSSRISALPVVDDAGKVLGVVSEADLLVKEADQAAYPGLFAGLRRRRDQEKAAGTTAADVMTTPPVMIRPGELVQRAALLMYDHGVKRLPVVDDAGHLLGIISRADVLSVFSRPDEEIRREVVNGLILRSFLVDPALFTVTVQDGIVTLAGRPETDEVGRNIIEATRRLAGVVAVRDRLLYSGGRRHAATFP